MVIVTLNLTPTRTEWGNPIFEKKTAKKTPNKTHCNKQNLTPEEDQWNARKHLS